MKIYLVRHPETVANRDGIIYGWMDYPYTEYGQGMLENIPKYFRDMKIDALYSSPIGRAERLAQAISKEVELDIQKDDRLKEMNFGILEGCPFDELDVDQRGILDKMFSDFENFQVPGGESGADIRDRGKAFFEELLQAKEQKGKTVVVVAHAMLIQMALISLLDMDIKKAWSFRLKPGMIIKLKVRKDFTTIEEMITYETLVTNI